VADPRSQSKLIVLKGGIALYQWSANHCSMLISWNRLANRVQVTRTTCLWEGSTLSNVSPIREWSLHYHQCRTRSQTSKLTIYKLRTAFLLSSFYQCRLKLALLCDNLILNTTVYFTVKANATSTTAHLFLKTLSYVHNITSFYFNSIIPSKTKLQLW
jgi:hypothetical protein